MADFWWSAASGNWSTNTNWKDAASGGNSPAAAPTAADDVKGFQTGNEAASVTITTGATCREFNFSNGNGCTLTGTGTLAISGSATWPLGSATVNHSGGITFNSTGAGNTVTPNGKSLACTLTFNGVGGEWTLAGALTTSGKLRVTNGTFIDGGYSVTTLSLVTDAGGSLNLTSALLTLTGNATTAAGSVLVVNASSGLTSTPTLTDFTDTDVSKAKSSYVLTSPVWGKARLTASAAGTLNIAGTYGDVEIASTTGSLALAATASVATLDMSAATSGTFAASTYVLTIRNNLVFNATLTRTGTCGLTFAGTSGTQTINTAGVSLASAITFNNSGTSIKLLGAFTTSGALTWTAGTLDLNGYSFTHTTSKVLTCSVA